MAPTVQPAPIKKASAATGSAANPVVSRTREGVGPASGDNRSDDGTSQLLTWGGWTLGTGLLCAVLMKTVLGGISPQGPHTNSGWLALIVTMMCLPFGFLLSLLGALKWLRNRRHRRF